MNRKFVLLVFITLQLTGLSLFGQGSVSGRVVNKTGSPVEAASVYVNGTTLRASTIGDGTFELRGVRFPCQLVVSYLGYQTEKVSLDSASNVPLLFKLKEKDFTLSEVLVKGKDKREELMQSFRDNFLGNDTWGRKATLLNEKALVFKVSYNEDTTSTSFSTDKISLNSIMARNFVVQAKVPLQVDIPQLGYTVFVDLDTFSLIRTKPYYNASTGLNYLPTEICRYVGSYYCMPYDSVSKSKQNRFERNRKEAFYNSRMHFCQALYRKELLKNGFLLLTQKTAPLTGLLDYDWVNLDSCSRYDNKGNLYIYGQAGKKLNIFYFDHADGSPVDLSKKNYKNPMEYVERYGNYYLDSNRSSIYFVSDTCVIQSNGNVPDTAISFDGKISKKKVGATLPDDYILPEK